MRHIVGAMIGTVITNSPALIRKALKDNPASVKRFLSKTEMELMSACDLGQQWDDMAKSPVLFIIDDGKLYPPEAIKEPK